MNKKTYRQIIKRGSVADITRQTAFENRTISTGKAILEGISIFAFFVLFVVAFAAW